MFMTFKWLIGHFFADEKKKKCIKYIYIIFFNFVFFRFSARLQWTSWRKRGHIQHAAAHTIIM